MGLLDDIKRLLGIGQAAVTEPASHPADGTAPTGGDAPQLAVDAVAAARGLQSSEGHVPRPASVGHGRAVPAPTRRPKRSVPRHTGLDISELNRRAVRRGVPTRPQDSATDPLDGIRITKEFRAVRRLIQEGCPLVFVTGNAGTGKSTLIHYLRKTLRQKLAVVAPTGVAALNVKGATIHSLFQFPHKIPSEEDIKLCNRKLFEKLELLIIDEVSIMSRP